MVSCDPLPLSSWLMVLLMVNKSGLACLVRIIVIVACFTTQVILVMIKGPPFFFPFISGLYSDAFFYAFSTGNRSKIHIKFIA